MQLRCRVFSFTEDYVKRQQNWWAVFIEGLDSGVIKVGVADFPIKSSIFWKIVAGECRLWLHQKISPNPGTVVVFCSIFIVIS